MWYNVYDAVYDIYMTCIYYVRMFIDILPFDSECRADTFFSLVLFWYGHPVLSLHSGTDSSANGTDPSANGAADCMRWGKLPILQICCNEVLCVRKFRKFQLYRSQEIYPL